jgi:glutaredoxin-like YruB-family protein
MKDITIYSTKSCHYCQMAKEYFTANSIVYKEHDVGTDAEARKEMVALSGQLGVPVIHIGDTVLVGFQEKAVAELLRA